jgi:Ca2+-transporting ATPase
VTSWHTISAEEAVRTLGTDSVAGLSSAEAARRLSQYGPNELTERRGKNPWRILLGQLTSFMVVLLIVAAAVSVFLGDKADAAAILAIVLLNSLIGFRQEYRAEKAMEALKKLAVPTVRVRRGARLEEISARELVPGDVVLLSEGNLLPADCRILESVNLRIREAALTGESEAAEKTPEPLSEKDLPLGDRRNMVFLGTVVAFGRATAVVTGTGMSTELGSIARMIQEVRREPTPLQRRLGQLGRTLSVLSMVLVGVVFSAGLLRGEDVNLLFLTAVSLAVAAVPEGLPAVVTIALALGAQRMLRRNALIRKLPAVETLGTVTVICCDKTGTLTGNRMEVAVLDAAGSRIDLSETSAGSAPIPPEALLLLSGGALCNDAVMEEGGRGDPPFPPAGDPTEAALAAAAARCGLRKEDLERAFPRAAEAPFDPSRRRMTTVHRCLAPLPFFPDGAPFLAFTKGAVDGLLAVSGSVWRGGRAEPMDGSQRARIESACDRMAQEGLRVLGVGFRPLRTLPGPGTGDARLERELTFIGMAGLIDPARPGVKEAVRTCRAAGIRPVMITGDHPLTARRIASDLGISAEGRVLTGRDLSGMSGRELEAQVEEVSVYARVAPEQKLKIVTALQNRGHVVAMTGDGVNDAPALKKADIGVAMGRGGTDAAKEASDMVLLDDNFATIVGAVEEGRVLYDNIRKFIRYLLVSNFGEILVMVLAPFLGMPLPLLPLQILWINLVTDGLPALALAVEPAEKGAMHRPPRPPTERILGQGMGLRILGGGALMGLVALGAGYAYWSGGQGHWQTMVFSILTFTQMGNVLALRSGRESLFRAGLLSNRLLLAAVALTVAMQLTVVYLPLLQGIFRTVPLGGKDLAVCLVASSAVFWAIELDKLRARRDKVLPG